MRLAKESPPRRDPESNKIVQKTIFIVKPIVVPSPPIKKTRVEK